MKNFFVLPLFVAFSVAVSAQTFTAKTSSGGGFDVTSGVETKDVFELDGKTFPVRQTNNGSRYVTATSKSDNPYAVWLGQPTENEFEGRTVYVTKNGSFCVYIIGSNGFPYAKWLDKN